MDNLNRKEFSESLRRDGIVIIDEYLDEAKCDEIRREVNAWIENGMRTADPDMGYAGMAGADEPILNQRSGDRDDGMLDIFNMDLAIPELREVKQDNFIQEVIGYAAQETYTPETLNIYVNRSVTNTRDYHADTYSGKYKSFIYLTDVTDVSYGPFSYIKGSHRPSRIRRRFRSFVNNRFRDVPSTNAVVYDDSDAETCVAPRGTLVIANQAGLHRGIPQEKGKERVMISTHYVPDSDTN